MAEEKKQCAGNNAARIGNICDAMAREDPHLWQDAIADLGAIADAQAELERRSRAYDAVQERFWYMDDGGYVSVQLLRVLLENTK